MSILSPMEDAIDLERYLLGIQERARILAFIREQAAKGTADYEHKLTKLADAIERGEHEEA
jgi:hypothetical protein